MSLFHDLITQLGLVCTSRLFEKEARFSQPMTREQLSSKLGLPSAPTEAPLILSLISGAVDASPRSSMREEASLASAPIKHELMSPAIRSTEIKEAQGISDSFDEVDNSTPTRIPSFVGPSLDSGRFQLPAQALSPDEASAPYALPSDSAESMDSGGARILEDTEPHAQRQHQTNSFECMDTSGALSTCHSKEAVHLDDSDCQEEPPPDVDCQEDPPPDIDCQEDPPPEMVLKSALKPVPAVLAPIPRKNLPPLGPVHVSHANGPVGLNSPAEVPRQDWLAKMAPSVRDARMEGHAQDLLAILGSPRASEDDELPGLQRLEEDPDLFSDNGDMDGAMGLLPGSSSESGGEPEFGF